jgi:hypothetical protein
VAFAVSAKGAHSAVFIYGFGFGREETGKKIFENGGGMHACIEQENQKGERCSKG